MFMQVAIGAIGIGVVLMVGYIVVSQVRSALPNSGLVYQSNPCYGYPLSDTTYCNTTSVPGGPLSDNTSQYLSLPNQGYSEGTSAVQLTVFAGFGLIAVGIIVLAAFGLINVFQ